MKKIALCSLLLALGLVGNSFGDACSPKSNCGAKTVAATIVGISAGTAGGLVGGSVGMVLGPIGAAAGFIAGGVYAGQAGAQFGWDASYDADEYIYFSDMSCLECDTVQTYNSGECSNDTWVSNGNKVFRCDAPKNVVDASIKNLTLDVKLRDDKWVDETNSIGICSDSPVKSTSANKEYRISLKGSGEKVIYKSDGIVTVYNGKPCKYIEEIAETQCTFHDGSKHNLGESVEFDCSRSPDTPEFRQNARTGIKCYQSCLKRKSDNKLTNYWSVKTCPDDKGFVAFNSADYQKYTPDIPGYKRCDNASELPEIVVTPDIKSCKEKRTTAEGKACCDLPASEAKWENNQCKCLNDKEFKIVDGRGICVAKEQPVNPVDEGDCLYKLTMDVKCNNGHTYYKGQELPITKKQAERLGGCDRVKSDIDSLESILAVSKKEITQMQEIIKLVCGNSATSISPVVVVNYDAEKIKRAQDTLSNFASRASKEASGWKTEDGKFNTMRLASDLSAGVVLGTVGGVVSGVVIKKKQVEKGFDALHCTVGGQTIADWGDRFSVGLQR